MNSYVLDRKLFAALSTGGGGFAACHELATAERSKTMLMLRYMTALTEDTSHEDAACVRDAYRMLSRIHQSTPRAAERVLRQPAISAWAADTIRNLSNGSTDGAGPGRLAVIASAAAVRARYPYRASTLLANGIVIIPSLGHAIFSDMPDGEEATIVVTESNAIVCVAGKQVVIPASLENTSGWRALPELAVADGGVGFRVVLDDVDPYRFAQQTVVGGQLDTSDLKSWNAMLSAAWQILVRHHRPVAEELRTIIFALTPLKRLSPGIGRSATAPDCFGCIALSEPRDGISLAMTLAHELQHAKLAAVLGLTDLLFPDSGGSYYAAWRDDPRPAYGLLHGTYAYMGVTAFCRRQRLLMAKNEALPMHRDYVRWRQAVIDSVEVLSRSGQLTDLGRQFVDGMRETAACWREDEVPPAAVALARATAEMHRTRWISVHLGQVGEVSKSQSSL